MKAKFKIGDKVDFVNDFGVVFENKTITGIDFEMTPGEARYYYGPSDSPWFPAKESNLYPAGTYKKSNKDIGLPNKKIAKFLGYGDNYQELYMVDEKQVVLNDGELYSLSDYGEPIEKIQL